MTKTALYHCATINDIPAVIEKIIDSLDRQRIEKLFRNKKVLLKPNLCIDHPPEKGATTHPLVLDAVIKYAKDCGANVFVGDGSAIGVRGDVPGKTGIGAVCKKYSVPFIDFNREQGKLVELENALVLKQTMIAKTYFEMDTIVNLPVFKSNMLFWITGALKNMKGLMVGMEKHKPHYLGVPQAVADLNRMIRQDLIIMDGFIGMMGNGPAAGDPANARLLIGGFDPLAVDTLAARLMGFDPEMIPMLVYAKQANIGNTDYELAGDPVGSFNLKLKKPDIAQNLIRTKILGYLQRFVFKIFGKMSRIAVNRRKCKLCRRCVEMCPFHAITLLEQKILIDRNKCEFCLCCTEVCGNEAISLKGMLVIKENAIKGL